MSILMSAPDNAQLELAPWHLDEWARGESRGPDLITTPRCAAADDDDDELDDDGDDDDFDDFDDDFDEDFEDLGDEDIEGMDDGDALGHATGNGEYVDGFEDEDD